jgi:hypothetical protein
VRADAADDERVTVGGRFRDQVGANVAAGPVRFSTTTGWPQVSLSLAATMRP